MAHTVHSQPNTYIRVDEKDKPKIYQTKILPAEKSSNQAFESGKGELHGLKKFLQGTYSHFNFLFNANNKLNDALDMSRQSLQDDYTQLLSYDNYDLKSLSQNQYLDTAIEKANGALLLHDIRNQWNDEVYLILGKAFYYKMQWDTAAIHFQYLNYAFAPKEEGGYDIPIGSNISNKKQELTITSPKQKGFLKHNPRRNEGLVWLARALVMSGDITTGKGILTLLYQDPHLPKEILPLLNDCNARAFYFSKQYDSAAYYMDLSHSIAANDLDKSRRRYLAAQLWQLSGHNEEALKDFEYAASHSSDIQMEIYALLRVADLDANANHQQAQLDRLLTISKKSKYKDFKDLIYYLLGQKYLSQNDSSNAVKYFKEATQTQIDNSKEWKYRSFQKLGDIGEHQFEFNALVSNYDSIHGTFGANAELANLQNRKQAAQELGKALRTIFVQDSLLRLAALPEKEQEKVLKTELKRIRKALGLKDVDNTANNSFFNNNTSTPTDLFSGLSNNSGKWYFNNNDVKTQGYQVFVMKFGTRPNVDDWIRQSALQNLTATNSPTNGISVNNSAKIDSSLIDMHYLKEQLPNTPEKKQVALHTISDSYLNAGIVMEDRMDNYPAAIWFFQQAASSDSGSTRNREQLLYHLSTSYYFNGNRQAATALKEQLSKQYPNSRYLNLTTPNPKGADTIASEKTAAGKTYANIYNELISGAFQQARQDKLKADSLYGSQYWTPQLLYIESIYYVSERQDSIAIAKLRALQQMFPQSPMKEQAETMIDVLSRRSQIEDYLTKLQITLLQDTDEVFVRKGIDMHYNVNMQEKGPIKLKDSVSTNLTKNTVLNIPKVKTAPVDTTSKNGIPPYIISVDSAHYVVVLLDKVAKVFATETGNAFNRFNKQSFHNQELPIRMQPLDDRYQMAMIGPFKDAGDAYIYIDKVAPITPTRILPWLAKDKFSFTIISEQNLAILLQYKNLEDYKSKLHETFPGKF
ncbi:MULTISPECIES: type IX secretion system periplasmic lipoprotein PorW/SprE [Chitinophagaceae]